MQDVVSLLAIRLNSNVKGHDITDAVGKISVEILETGSTRHQKGAGTHVSPARAAQGLLHVSRRPQR